jgi:hypothetical protein
VQFGAALESMIFLVLANWTERQTGTDASAAIGEQMMVSAMLDDSAPIQEEQVRFVRTQKHSLTTQRVSLVPTQIVASFQYFVEKRTAAQRLTLLCHYPRLRSKILLWE